MAIDGIEDGLERLSVVIKASEDWGADYYEAPEQYAKILKLEARMERLLRRYFRELASDRVEKYVNWYAYEHQRQHIKAAAGDDFTVDVLVTETLDGEDGIILTVLFDEIATGIAIGAQASEVIYELPLGISDTTAEIQRAAKNVVAELVGRKVTKDGRIIEHPNPERSITETTRNKIKESIATSMTLGEDHQTAIKRLQRVIKDPKRADMIAQTEAVNAYQTGVYTHALMSGAVGKEWRDVGAIDVCHAYANAGGDKGYVAIEHEYSPGLTRPPAHSRCRCSLRIVYPEELE